MACVQGALSLHLSSKFLGAHLSSASRQVNLPCHRSPTLVSAPSKRHLQLFYPRSLSNLEVAFLADYLDSSAASDIGSISSTGSSLSDLSAAYYNSSSLGESYTMEDASSSSISTSSTPAQGGVGVVEAMTGKDVDENAVTGGDGDIGSGGGDGGGGGGDGGRGDDGEAGESGFSSGKKPFTMSQKLTLVYAALVGFGGLMGFIKTGSVKSLAAGGLAALSLLNVFINLPVNPVGACGLGVGVASLLLYVMGSRYRASGKFFPAGLVSLLSLIMAGGYIHGMLRSH